MGVGRITDAREVTQGTVHAAHDRVGESASRIAAIGAHAGRKAQRTIAAGLGDAAKNIGDTLKVVGDFAVKALWEKPIAEAEEKLRELDLECRSKGWRDENGVERPGFDLVRGAEAANIGEQWDAYMARKAKELTKNLTAGQREELSRRTAKFRTETRARLTERGTRELITSNLADIDIIATNDGERNVMQAVANANEAIDKFKESVGLTGDVEKATVERGRDDDAAAVSISDQLVTKRNELIRRKIEGGLGFKSEALATAEADKIVRAEALETVKALAAAGHYDRARKLVEQGKKLGYDDAALAKGRELVDGMEVNAAVNEANVKINAIRNADGSYPNDRVETIERSIATLQRVGAAQKKDSKLAADAAEAVAKLDRHADTIRVGEFFDGFDQSQIGRLDLEKAKNPYKKGTRDARCWDAARTAWVKNLSPEFNRERASARKNAIDLMKANQLNYVRDPQKGPAKYYEDLVGLERNGVITELDRKELIQKFEEGWAKGFVGQGNEQAMLLQKAEAIAKTLDEELGGAFRTEIRRDKDGFIKPAADGSLVYDPKAAPTDLTWREELVVPSRMAGTGMPGEAVYVPEMRSTVKHTLTAEEKLGIANKALALAKFDGMELGYDPVTGIPMEKGEKYKVNLVTDLKRMCRILKSRKEAERVRDQVFDHLRRGKPATIGDAIGGIDPLAAVRGPLGSFGAMTRTIGEYDAEVQADRTKAEGRKFGLGGMLQGLESESRSVKD